MTTEPDGNNLQAGRWGTLGPIKLIGGEGGYIPQFALQVRVRNSETERGKNFNHHRFRG